MKNTVIIIALGLVAIVGTCYTVISTREKANVAAEIAARAAESKQRMAAAKQKTSENERRKAELEKTTAEKKAAAAKAEKEAAEAKAREAAADEKTAAAEKAKAELDAKRAADEKASAEAEAKTAADKRATVEAELAIVAETNAQRQAELDIAVNRRLQAQAEQRTKEAEVKAAELKKLELDKRLAETAALQEMLRQREEATRPERTIKDIMDENARRRAEEEAAAAEAEERRLAELREKDYKAYEEEMARRRKINKEGVAGPRPQPLTAGDKILKSAAEEVDRANEEGRAAVRRRIVARLEPEIRQAIREGRVEDAEFCLKNLLLLVPDYKVRADLLKKE